MPLRTRTSDIGKRSRRGEAGTRLLPTIMIGMLLLVGLNVAVDIAFDSVDDRRRERFEADTNAAISLQTSLINAETGVRGYVLSGHPEFLEPYQASIRTLENLSSTLSPALGSYLPKSAAGTERSAADTVTDLRSKWETAIQQTVDNQREKATAVLAAFDAKTPMDGLRTAISAFLEERQAGLRSWEAIVNDVRVTIYVTEITASMLAVLTMIFGFRRITRAIRTGFGAQEQTELLFSMTDMLQSAAGPDDTNEVLVATAGRLLPGYSGALYVFNNSRDRLDIATRWGTPEDNGAENLLPTSCWALKRGKPHMNLLDDGALRCRHVTANQMTLEIPMAARGELYGMLEIGAQGDTAASRLQAIKPVASAIADAMSLALSSLALRERLRNQALRDPLTGLYNRRFLEEMLERLCLDAERRKTSVAAIMIDLDHFKKLNDQHGHAAGDAVLRDVASAILSCLRTSDIACRYGGEELAILLPDCPMALAVGKADQIRARIAEMTGAAGLVVTASLGVAAVPESAAGPTDLLPSADGALYQAKQQGRDRVCAAPSRIAGSGRAFAGEWSDAKSPAQQRQVAEPADTPLKS
jgi:diguanylate cyclase (GGDEF)-like protein